MTARLDIESDSSDLSRTAVDLDRVAQAAIEAGVAVDRLSDASRTSSTATQGQTSASREATTAISTEVAAIQRAFAAQNAFTQSTREQAAATRMATAELHTMRFGVANVAAQFQDIAVTSQMGMNPWVIALQQGTQLSQAFGPQGVGGAVRMLGGALLSILSPVSLLTIAIVGLGATAIQSLGSIWKEEETVADHLKAHSEWLDEILAGYDDVREAANAAAESAMRLPQAVVESDLEGKIAEIVGQIDEKLGGLREKFQAELDFIQQMRDVSQAMGETGEGWTQAEDAIEAMRELGLTTNSTIGEINAAKDSIRALMETTDDPGLRDMAAAVLELLDRLAALRGEAYSTAAALATLQNQALAAEMDAAADAAEKAIEGIRRLAPELRTTKEQARDLLNEAMGSAPDAILRQVAVKEYEQTIAAIDENERRLEANRAARKAASAGSKRDNRWEREILENEERIEALRMEARLLGQSERAAAQAREEFRLLNEAKSAGIPITEELTERVRQMSAEYADAAADLEAQKDAQERWNELLDFSKDLTGSFLIDIKNNLKETGDLWGSVADAAESALDRVLDKMLQAANDAVWGMLADAIVGSFGGGGDWDWLTGMFGKKNALGGVYASPALSSMSNTIQDRPTIFPFAQGIGLLGEDRDSPGEAIMPLMRSADGSLGVKAMTSSGSGDVQINMTVIEGANENRAEANKRADGGIDVRMWLMAEVTREASTRGTTLNQIIRSQGGNNLTRR